VQTAWPAGQVAFPTHPLQLLVAASQVVSAAPQIAPSLWHPAQTPAAHRAPGAQSAGFAQAPGASCEQVPETQSQRAGQPPAGQGMWASHFDVAVLQSVPAAQSEFFAQLPGTSFAHRMPLHP
jgi:hypothetical protein